MNINNNEIFNEIFDDFIWNDPITNYLYVNKYIFLLDSRKQKNN